MALAAAKDKAEQTAKALGIQLGRIISVNEAPSGHMWSNGYFPQAEQSFARGAGGTSIGGVLQPLSLDITIGFELAKTV